MNRLHVVLGIIALVAFLAWQFPYAMADHQDKMQLLYSVTLAIVIIGTGMSLGRMPIKQNVKYALIWLLLILAGVLAYSYKDAFLSSRLGAELVPNRARMTSSGSISLRASEGGHFYVEARVNGVPVNFMIDTGASDVMLSKRDAKRVGFDPDTLNYTRTYATANGMAGGAPVKLKMLQIGPMALYDLPASVNGGDMEGSLLGMSALNRLGGFKVDGDEMTIGSPRR